MKLTIFIYVIILFLFSIFSYSQIDLNLTLSSNNIYQSFQNNLIQLGYYNRNLSAIIYIFFLSSLLIIYILFLRMVSRNKVSTKLILRLIILTGIITFISYSAFSHDLFNYMFDARIVTKYGLNPYLYKALDFPFDLWTRFMHWTHRTYPYGPSWLIITLPFSYLGFQKFIPTLFLFKTLFVFTYFTNCYLIYKISKENKLLNLAFFAFNPLIIIESLISPHNDSLMLVFALLAFYLLIIKKYGLSIVAILVSCGIKFITGLFFVVDLYYLIKPKEREKLSIPKLAVVFSLIYLLGLIPVIVSREVLPWYGITLLGFIALVNRGSVLRLIGIVLSFGLLIKYVSFLYQGEWTSAAYNNYLSLLIMILLSTVGFYFIATKLKMFTYNL